MEVKIQIESVFGEVLFELEKENNTLKETLREANLRGANLYGADLYGADLYEANLRGANLYGADLRGADLYEANLRGANLYGANLRGANLYGADLRETDLYGADLRGADLRGADLRGALNINEALIPMFCKWSNGIKGNKIVIGCKEKTIEEWDLFFNSSEIYDTQRGTEEFKQIQAVYNALKAYYNTLSS